MKKLSLIALILLSTFVSCKDDDNDPGLELLNNNELEIGEVSNDAPEGWFNFEAPNQTAGIFDFEWTDEEALSGEKSIKISSTEGSTDDFGSWGFRFPFNSVENVDREIELSIWIKGDLVGQGVSIVLRGDNIELSDESATFKTSQSDTSITDNFDWTEYKISDKVVEGITHYAVFFVFLQNTTGEVYFDNVSVVKK